MKIFTLYVYFVQRPWEICAAASEHISYVCGSSGNISCFLRNVRLFLKDINMWLLLKENVQLIFLCVWLLLRIFHVF